MTWCGALRVRRRLQARDVPLGKDRAERQLRAHAAGATFNWSTPTARAVPSLGFSRCPVHIRWCSPVAASEDGFGS